LQVASGKAFVTASVLGIFATFYAAYLYFLYSPGLILWQPDFLAFMSDQPSRFFPGGYGALVQLFGGGVAAGRWLTSIGLALVICILAVSTLRLSRHSIPACVLFTVVVLSAPSIFSSTLSPSVDMLYSAFGLSLLASCFIIADDSRGPLPRYTPQLLFIYLLSSLLWQLRFHAPVLLFAAAISLFPAWRNHEARIASALLAALGIGFLLLAKPIGYASTAKEQVWCGLEFRYHRLAEQGVLDGLPRAGDLNGYVWDEYGKIVELAASSSYLDYYSPTELLKHGVINYSHYLRRPLVLLGIVSAIVALMLGVKRRQALCVFVFLFLYPLPLSAAYYTLRASLLTEIVGLAAAVLLAGNILAQADGGRRLTALYAYTLALLAAIAISIPRLNYEIGEWRSQLSEAAAVEKAVNATQADGFSIWTEDTGITVRVHDRPIANMSQAYYSWLNYSGYIFALDSGFRSYFTGKNEYYRVVPPDVLIARNGDVNRLLLIRTPGIAQAVAANGEWQKDEVRNGAKVLYILMRKSSALTPKPSKP
jgi:hypothetical protein